MSLALLAMANTVHPAALAETTSTVQQPLADFRWTDAQGNTHRLSDTHGKPRLLHFWASWCIPCRQEMPQMLRWQRENPDIPVIPLSMDQRIGQTIFFIRKFELDMPPLRVREEDRKALKIPALPYTLLISESGVPKRRLPGVVPWENQDLKQLFNGYLDN